MGFARLPFASRREAVHLKPFGDQLLVVKRGLSIKLPATDTWPRATRSGAEGRQPFEPKARYSRGGFAAALLEGPSVYGWGLRGSRPGLVSPALVGLGPIVRTAQTYWKVAAPPPAIAQ